MEVHQSADEPVGVALLVPKPGDRRVLWEVASERDPLCTECRRIARLRFDPALAGEERGVVEMQNLMAAAREFATQRRLEGGARVIVNSDPHRERSSVRRGRGSSLTAGELLLNPRVGLRQ